MEPVKPIEELVTEPTKEQKDFAQEQIIRDYPTAGYKMLVGRINYGPHFNIYWKEPNTNSLVLDILNFYQHNVSNAIVSISTASQLRESDRDITQLLELSKQEISILKALVGEVNTLYRSGYLNFSLWGIPSDEIKQDFKSIGTLLEGIQQINIGNPDYIVKTMDVVQEMLKTSDKYIKAMHDFDVKK